LLVNL